MRKLFRRLNYLFHRRRIERELEEEMSAHREMLAADRKQSFGSDLRLREQTRDVWGSSILDALIQDLRYGARNLRLSPGATLMATLTLALGIGLNLALFQMVNAYLLTPPHLQQPETLVRLSQRSQSQRGGGLSSAFAPETADFIRDNSTLFESVIYHAATTLVWGDDLSDRVDATFVSPNYFTTLGADAVLGRVFDASVDGAGAAPVAVLSFRVWESRLGSDPAVVGKTIRLNERPVTIVGVAPASFPGVRPQSATDVWLPITSGVPLNVDLNRYSLYARLTAGVADAAICQQSELLLRNAPMLSANAGPDSVNTLTAAYATYRFAGEATVRNNLRTAALIGCLTLLVLLIACANLSNLVLSRTISRMRELSVRASLGASSGRIVRQLLTESLLLSTLGAALGVAMGWATARIISGVVELPPYLDLAPGPAELGVAGCLAMLATLAIGLLPAGKVVRLDMAPTMKDGGNQASSTMQRTRLQKLLVAGQVAGSCLLLIVAGLVAQNLRLVVGSQLGYDFRDVGVLEAPLSQLGIEDEDARVYWEQVRDQVAALPGVADVAIATSRPLSGDMSRSMTQAAPKVMITQARVEPRFFGAVRIPLLYGRPFAIDDDPETTMLISRSVALAAFEKENAVGETFQEHTVVGVVDDARFLELMEPNSAQTYTPLRPTDWNAASLILRADDVESLLPALRTIARQLDDRILPDAHLMEADFARTVQNYQLISTLSSLIALLAMTLACLSVFSVVSYNAAMRTKEIGIRRALGAQAASVVALLTGQLAWISILGIAAGALGAWQVAKLFAGAPLYMSEFNFPVLALAAALLGLTAIAAGVIPALRALRKDPLDALRYE